LGYPRRFELGAGRLDVRSLRPLHDHVMKWSKETKNHIKKLNSYVYMMISYNNNNIIIL